MRVQGIDYRTVWIKNDRIKIINQNRLPFAFEILDLPDVDSACEAIVRMHVRGAGAIGALAGYAMALAFKDYNKTQIQPVLEAKRKIEATRPTARNLFYATEKVWTAGMEGGYGKAMETAEMLAEENIAEGRAIAEYGESLIPDECYIMTHCNAGWLGFVDWGSALAPIYMAHRKGKKIFVYVSETRPRLQGARLTAWELTNEGIPHAIISDGASAFIMQNNKVDAIITGADRIALNGDTANKIGTLDKAILAHHFGIPFYVATPLSTIDFNCEDGTKIPIEHREEEEVLFANGINQEGHFVSVGLASPGSSAINPAFDVTPGSLINLFITSQGFIKPDEISSLKEKCHV
ncbi:MAG: translation initiation factor eIF-2B subunit alpha [Bacteroidales bacterium]|jgi:S-methyl-5-thioribose-1-phosphate isomerase|nr:translation initiation factor eIF-2B subunit alpha [Bacteroidales bacterium]MDN5328396.1 translation initiation factor eIF-2B subunit alpha [Bacteroidales bacterium]